jgi:CRISPR system Cascade subunit CasD
MKKLQLTLSAPIASFSDSPRCQHRLTQPLPTKSAIAGMIACAQGLSQPRIKDFTLEVLLVKHGPEMVDFQTVQNAATVGGDSGRNGLTYRYYYVDYRAIVEISSTPETIDEIEAALRCPVWPLYLGRRANILNRPPLNIACEFSKF